MSFEALITTFVTLFVVIDPIAVAPLFVALTRGMPEPQRRLIALRAILIAFGLLAIFGLAGNALLGGHRHRRCRRSASPAGCCSSSSRVDMLFERRTERRERRTEAEDGPDPSVFPLAMPMIAGPGALATMILLSTQYEGDTLALVEVNLVLVVVLALTWLLFRAGGMIERLLGHTGIVVLTRLFGILLAALAVQFVLNGLRDLGLLA